MADDGEADGAAAPPGGEEALIGGVDPKLLRKALKKRVLYIEKHMECVHTYVCRPTRPRSH